MCVLGNPWGYSSVGRALPSHGRGQGFESPYLHHNALTKKMSEPEKPAAAGFSASQKPHFYFLQTVDVKTAFQPF